MRGAQGGQLGADVAQLVLVGEPLALDLQHRESIEEIRWSDVDLHGRDLHLSNLHMPSPRSKHSNSLPRHATKLPGATSSSILGAKCGERHWLFSRRGSTRVRPWGKLRSRH